VRLGTQLYLAGSRAECKRARDVVNGCSVLKAGATRYDGENLDLGPRLVVLKYTCEGSVFHFDTQHKL
jgi:hypothetical protein